MKRQSQRSLVTAAGRGAIALVATLALTDCVGATATAGPTVMFHSSGIVAPGGQARLCAGLSSPPNWAYCNPVIFTAGYDLASGRTLLSGTLGAEVHTHPQPWGTRIGLHGGILAWSDQKDLNYQVAGTASLLRVLAEEQGGSDGVTWSTAASLDLTLAGTWGDTIAPGLLVIAGVSLAFDVMKGYRFNLNFH